MVNSILINHAVLLQSLSDPLISPVMCVFMIHINCSSFTFLPNAEDDLQQGANARDKEDGADEVTLREAVMLQTQALRQDQRDGDDSSKCSQTVLRGKGTQVLSNVCNISFSNANTP